MSDVQRYETELCVAVDGMLWKETRRVVERVGPEKTRVLVESRVPETGPEFDGRELLGADFDVCVIESVRAVRRRMKLRGFVLKSGLGHVVAAHTLFECPTRTGPIQRLALRTGTPVADLLGAVEVIRMANPGVSDADAAQMIENSTCSGHRRGALVPKT